MSKPSEDKINRELRIALMNANLKLEKIEHERILEKRMKESRPPVSTANARALYGEMEEYPGKVTAQVNKTPGGKVQHLSFLTPITPRAPVAPAKVNRHPVMSEETLKLISDASTRAALAPYVKKERDDKPLRFLPVKQDTTPPASPPPAPKPVSKKDKSDSGFLNILFNLPFIGSDVKQVVTNAKEFVALCTTKSDEQLEKEALALLESDDEAEAGDAAVDESQLLADFMQSLEDDVAPEVAKGIETEDDDEGEDDADDDAADAGKRKLNAGAVPAAKKSKVVAVKTVKIPIPPGCPGDPQLVRKFLDIASHMQFNQVKGLKNYGAEWKQYLEDLGTPDRAKVINAHNTNWGLPAFLICTNRTFSFNKSTKKDFEKFMKDNLPDGWVGPTSA